MKLQYSIENICPACLLLICLVVLVTLTGCNPPIEFKTNINPGKTKILYNDNDGYYTINNGKKEKLTVVIAKKGVSEPCDIDIIKISPNGTYTIAVTNYIRNKETFPPNFNVKYDNYILFLSKQFLKHRRVPQRVTDIEWVNNEKLTVKMYKRKPQTIDFHN